MSTRAVDPATFHALQESAGAEFVADLVDAFLEEAPRMLRDLAVAQDEGSVENFRRTAHSLKSNSLTFGASPLGAMARELELGAAAAVKGDRTAIESLAREYERVKVALTELRDG